MDNTYKGDHCDPAVFIYLCTRNMGNGEGEALLREEFAFRDRKFFSLSIAPTDISVMEENSTQLQLSPFKI